MSVDRPIADGALEEARRHVRRKRIFYLVLGIWLALSLMWFLIDLADDSSSYWFYWPMLGTGIAVAPATNWGIGADSSRARRTATATCSTSSATAAKGRSATPTPASSRRRSPATASSGRPTSPGTRPATSRPPFHDFVIYQLHVGTFFTPNLPAKGGTFLDVARKIPHLAEPSASPPIQLLPIQEFQTTFSLGYNGTDYFSPEMDFAVEDADLGAVCRSRSTSCSTPRASRATGSRTCAAR